MYVIVCMYVPYHITNMLTIHCMSINNIIVMTLSFTEQTDESKIFRMKVWTPNNVHMFPFYMHLHKHCL